MRDFPVVEKVAFLSEYASCHDQGFIAGIDVVADVGAHLAQVSVGDSRDARYGILLEAVVV